MDLFTDFFNDDKIVKSELVIIALFGLELINLHFQLNAPLNDK